MDRSSVLTAVLTVMLLPGIAEAQLSERAAWAANVPNEYRVVPDLLEGPNRRDPVVEWLGGLSDRFEVAKRVTPLNYVRADLPPILTIHGDADPVVPYSHAVRLHGALEAAGARHELHTVPGGGGGMAGLPATRL